MYSVGILTVSDKGSEGAREDTSGLLLHQIVAQLPGKVIAYKIVPDEQPLIAEALIWLSDQCGVQIAFTTGGTGVSPRDVTPEATLSVIERVVPGLGEIMRSEGYKTTPMAMISRAVAGIRGRSLIVNLPGSPRAVRENFDILLPALPHLLDKIAGDPKECGPN